MNAPIPTAVSEDNIFFLLTEALIRVTRLEKLEAPIQVLGWEYANIKRRIGSISPEGGAQRIRYELEEALIRRITLSFETSCITCSKFAFCPGVKGHLYLVSGEGAPPAPYPHENNASTGCREFQADWDQYLESGRLYPDLVNRLQETFGISLNRTRIARHLLSMMGRWAGISHTT